jgi:hypothetical protein
MWLRYTQPISFLNAGVAELEDAAGLGPAGLRPLEVRVLSPALDRNPLLRGASTEPGMSGRCPISVQTPRDACGSAAGSYREGMRLGLTLAVIGTAIGIAGGILFGVFWLVAVPDFLTPNSVEDFLGVYGPLTFSLIVLITALLWRSEFPRTSRVIIAISAVCLVLSGLWIAYLYYWDSFPD